MNATLRPLAILAVTLSAFVACESTPEGNTRYAAAQSIVDGVAIKHDLVRLSIHAVPQGASAAVFVASTDMARVGNTSDPEDVTALENGATTVLREGDNHDVTVAIKDGMGQIIAATGITMSLPAGTTDDEAKATAEAIAMELQDAINASPDKLW
ncbi:MAG: hypothetical protein H6834_14570 [Planctomycetes bacterium]|nr:hypothetical protein [Planctomycetota bacterium]